MTSGLEKAGLFLLLQGRNGNKVSCGKTIFPNW